MLKPHHKSYYLFFESQSKKSFPKKYRNQKLRIELAIKGIKRSDCISSLHHFYNKMKQSLELGGMEIDQMSLIKDELERHDRSVEAQRLNMFNRTDYRLDMPEESTIHPWNARHNWRKKNVNVLYKS